MFKNITLFKITQPLQLTVLECADALAQAQFAPCAPSQEKASGWLEPRGQEHGSMVESVAGQWIMLFKSEAKSVPSAVVKRKVEQQVRQIERDTGRKPGKKERRDMSDMLRQSLLPQAFSKESTTWVWMDVQQGFLVVGTTSQSRIDEILTHLSEQLNGFVCQSLQTTTPPAVAMARWLQNQEAGEGFDIDTECELKASDESKASVRYARHSLLTDEVVQHIQQGKRPTSLALTYQDKVSFTLTESLQLKKIRFSDSVFEQQGEQAGTTQEDNFDTDWALTTGELQQLIPALIEALDGELPVPAAS